MSNNERPLSPHLTIYRWPISMTLSILHRMTGVALSVGLIAFVVWLESIAFGEASFRYFAEVFGTPIGRILLVGWTFCFFFHLANGVRHLFWDAGQGFEKQQSDRSAWMVVVFSIVSTAGYWWLVPGGTS